MITCYCLSQSKVVASRRVLHSLRQSSPCWLSKLFHLESGKRRRRKRHTQLCIHFHQTNSPINIPFTTGGICVLILWRKVEIWVWYIHCNSVSTTVTAYPLDSRSVSGDWLTGWYPSHQHTLPGRSQGLSTSQQDLSQLRSHLEDRPHLQIQAHWYMTTEVVIPQSPFASSCFVYFEPKRLSYNHDMYGCLFTY